MIKALFITILMVFAGLSLAYAQQKPLVGNDYNAGLQWAEDQDIQDSTECKSGSKSFIDGCKAWIDDGDASNMDEEDSGDDRED